MLAHSAPVFASIDITFVNSKPGLKVAFKGDYYSKPFLNSSLQDYSTQSSN